MIQPSARAVGPMRTMAKFGIPGNKRTMYGSQSTQVLLQYKKEAHHSIESTKPYCHTNKRQMYRNHSNPSLTVIEIRDKCMAVSAPKIYCHTNERQMYGSSTSKSYCHTK